MTADQLHAELEQDRAWREAEILFFQNRCAELDEADRERFLRALVLIVYAHVEGFTKFALLGYVRCVNAASIACGEAKPAIAAAALSEVFQALRNPSSKSSLFKDVPDDSALHRLARDGEFIARSSELLAGSVTLPDTSVDTGSNLWPVVLRKNLFRLGLPFERFDHLDADLNILVNTRNEIGHGAIPKPVKWTLYEKLRGSAMTVMRDLQATLFSASSLQWYRK